MSASEVPPYLCTSKSAIAVKFYHPRFFGYIPIRRRQARHPREAYRCAYLFTAQEQTLMKRTVVILAAAAALVAGGAAVAVAHGERGGPLSHLAERLNDELDLNREQRETLRAITADAYEFMREVRRERAAKMAALLKRDKVTAAEINAAIPSRDEMAKEIREFASAKIADFHAVLTPQQRARLADKVDEFGIGNWRGGRGFGGKRGWGRGHGWGHHGEGRGWGRGDGHGWGHRGDGHGWGRHGDGRRRNWGDDYD
jgi:Spy/CpxP family protein refolding chaperone